MRVLFAVILSAVLIGCAQVYAGGQELTRTSWQLVKIMSMDDSVYTPEAQAAYTLTFGESGTAHLQADCNRGRGTWQAPAEGQLRFHDLAVTKSKCAPGSLSERYVSQFKWVRSYLLKDGHLFLATKADGSIIEFEPIPLISAVANVLGEDIYSNSAEETMSLIVSRLFADFMQNNGIKAEQDEIDAIIDDMEEKSKNEKNSAWDDLSDKERSEALQMRRVMVKSMVERWKLNRALYDRFGGRIIYQQLGYEPLDAYRQFFTKRQQEGAFVFYDPEYRTYFWEYFTNEQKHVFVKQGSDEEARVFSVVPWEE